jgi:hypothetical protein
VIDQGFGLYIDASDIPDPGTGTVNTIYSQYTRRPADIDNRFTAYFDRTVGIGVVPNAVSSLRVGGNNCSTITNFGMSVTPDIGSSLGTIPSAYGVYVNPSLSSSVGTVSDVYGARIDRGVTGLPGGVTRAYGLYVDAPSYGSSSRVATYSDNLCVGYTGTSPPSSGALFRGNVGFGTTTANSSLDIVKAITLNDFTTMRSIRMGVDANPSYSFYLGAGGTSTGFAGVLQSLENGSGSGAMLLLNPSGGNVGIGLVPEVKFHVAGSVMSTAVETVEIVRLLRGVTPSIRNPVSAGLRLGSFEAGIVGRGRLDVMVSGTPDAGNQFGNIPNVTVATLNGNGNIGIGTTSPNTLVDIVKTVTTNNFTTMRSIRMGVDTNPSYSFYLGAGGTSTGFAGVMQSLDNGSGSNLLLNPSGGNVGIGIGAASITYPLVVQGPVDTTLSIFTNVNANGKNPLLDVGGGFAWNSSGSQAEMSYWNTTSNPTTSHVWYQRTAGGRTMLMTLDPSGVLQTFGSVQPSNDNAVTCGSSGKRWSAVWAVNGTIQTSDEALKTDIKPTRLGLDFITHLQPIEFKWKDRMITDSDGNTIPCKHQRKHHGFSAQQVLQVLADLNIPTNDFAGFVDPLVKDSTASNSPIGLRYDQFISPLVRSCQELAAANIQLRERIQSLEGQVTTILSALELHNISL